MMPSGMLTDAEGPVVCSEKTFRALVALRREKLIAEVYTRVVMARSNWRAVIESEDVTRRGDASFDLESPPPWLDLIDEKRFVHVELPARCGEGIACSLELDTLRLAVGLPASLVLLDGLIKEKAKLSFIKAEGTVSILVMAYRLDKLSAVQPMVKALQKLGHGEVIPPPETLEALWRALEGLS